MLSVDITAYRIPAERQSNKLTTAKCISILKPQNRMAIESPFKIHKKEAYGEIPVDVP